MNFSSKPIFDLKAVSYSYPNGQVGLNNINFTVSEGEVVVLLGCNGSGKSTLLKLLDGLIFPNKGIFSAFGKQINKHSFENESFSQFFRRQISLVFQDSDIQLFSPTVYEELAFGPLQLGMPDEKVRERIEEIMNLLEIAKLKDKEPHQLSGGEKKKVAIASVLTVSPSILLLDEPTNNLDPRTKAWLIELIDKLGNSLKTVIASTQDLEFARRVADRIVVIGENHQVVADDDSEIILADTKLLTSANLIHKHWHQHDGYAHQHFHVHDEKHAHSHPDK
jgi:cobalt/nickel transport system ATP-binding protein